MKPEYPRWPIGAPFRRSWTSWFERRRTQGKATRLEGDHPYRADGRPMVQWPRVKAGFPTIWAPTGAEPFRPARS